MNLPLELISNVGDFLEPFDMAQLCLISKKWNEQWTPFLYAHIVVRGSMLQYDTARDPKATYGYDIAQSLKKHASLIRSLSLSNFGALEFDCLMACISCPSIAENAIFNGSALSVTRAAGQLSRITLKDFEYAHCIVHSLLQEQPNLREIIISPRGWGSGLEYAFLDLFEMMPQWKQLETFELGSMFPSAKMPFKYLVKFLGRCPTLRRLVLHGLLIEGYSDFVCMSESQYHFPPLIRLDLSFSKEHHVPRKPMIHPALSYLLRHLPTLQHLSVHSQAAFDLAHIPADQTWRYVLANNRALKNIDFFNHSKDYDVEGLRVVSGAVVEAISNICFQSLTSIFWMERACPKTPDRAFVELFRRCQNLQHISLYHSIISDVALEALAATQESLACLRPRPVGLQSLSLVSCHNISAAPLARILYCCRSISSLAILNCSPTALGLFTRPLTSDDRGQCATTSAIAAASPGNTLWACSDKLEILNLELNAHRYKDEVLRESDQTDVHDDQSVLYDNDVVADDNPMMYLNILLSDLDQESPYHGLRIPDEFTDDEMDLIRRQLDALGILKVLRLGGEAMSYDLLTVPQSSHFHPSESSSLSNFSLQSEGPEHTASRDYKDLKVKALDKKEHRAVRPLLTKNPDYIHISTNIPPINRNGEYQSPDASRLHRHEALKLREIADWWRTYANPLLERGEIGTKYHSQLYKAYFCYYGTS